MTLGLVVGNFIPRKSKEVFELVGSFTPPIYVLFFVLVGAKLDISHMTLPIIILLGIYLLGRSAGKFIGSNFGAHLAKAPATVRKYLPLCLFSQAGVAIGLSILASHYFSGELGNSIVIIITASTFVLEIIGPPLVKVAVVKAGEAGLNITEEDLIQTSNAKDIMEANFPFIVKNVSLGEIIKIFSESNNLYYPVVDSEKKLLGIITVDNIKNTFMETSLNHFLLADDLMEPVVKTASPETTVAEIIKLLKIYHLECIPVVLDDNRLIGLIERRRLDRVISTKMMELQRQADFLEGE